MDWTKPVTAEELDSKCVNFNFVGGPSKSGRTEFALSGTGKRILYIAFTAENYPRTVKKAVARGQEIFLCNFHCDARQIPSKIDEEEAKALKKHNRELARPIIAEVEIAWKEALFGLNGSSIDRIVIDKSSDLYNTWMYAIYGTDKPYPIITYGKINSTWRLFMQQPSIALKETGRVPSIVFVNLEKDVYVNNERTGQTKWGGTSEEVIFATRVISTSAKEVYDQATGTTSPEFSAKITWPPRGVSMVNPTLEGIIEKEDRIVKEQMEKIKGMSKILQGKQFQAKENRRQVNDPEIIAQAESLGAGELLKDVVKGTAE